MRKIQMVDLQSQYQRIKPEIDAAWQNIMESCAFINGPAVKQFQSDLEQYLHVKHVIPCGNGTEAIQVALMALDLQPGDEVILPANTYIATHLGITENGLVPVCVEPNPRTLEIDDSLTQCFSALCFFAIAYISSRFARISSNMHIVFSSPNHGGYGCSPPHPPSRIRYGGQG